MEKEDNSYVESNRKSLLVGSKCNTDDRANFIHFQHTKITWVGERIKMENNSFLMNDILVLVK